MSYRPNSVVAWQRAIELLLNGRAEAVVELERIISSPSVAVFLPSTIRLRVPTNWVQLHRTRARKRAIHERDRWTCGYCGFRAIQSMRLLMTIDHIYPRSRGGSLDDPINMISACGPCNQRKMDRTPEEARMPLLFPARELTWNDRTVFALTRGRTLPPDWEPFFQAA